MRLKNKYNPNAKVYLSVWWHYMCAQHVTTDLGYFVRDGNLDGLFGVSSNVHNLPLSCDVLCADFDS